MKKALKILGILIVIGAIGGILVYFFVINKPHPDYDKAEAEYSLQAADLFESYQEDRKLAGEKYNGKVVEITGTLNEVEQTDSLKVAVFIFNTGMFGDEGIRVSMLPKYNEQLDALSLPSEVSIKAYCTGYNDVDVVMKKGSVTAE